MWGYKAASVKLRRIFSFERRMGDRNSKAEKMNSEAKAWWWYLHSNWRGVRWVDRLSNEDIYKGSKRSMKTRWPRCVSVLWGYFLSSSKVPVSNFRVSLPVFGPQKSPFSSFQVWSLTRYNTSQNFLLKKFLKENSVSRNLSTRILRRRFGKRVGEIWKEGWIWTEVSWKPLYLLTFIKPKDIIKPCSGLYSKNICCYVNITSFDAFVVKKSRSSTDLGKFHPPTPTQSLPHTRQVRGLCVGTAA